MSSSLPPNTYPIRFAKRMRRSATSVMAGAFDPRPPRDVLTSLLNGVPPYIVVEKEEEERRVRKRERKERERERKKEKAAFMAQGPSSLEDNATLDMPVSNGKIIIPPVNPSGGHSRFWKVTGRPKILIPSAQRSVSVTPPPSPIMLLPSSPASTPGPSNSSSISRTSSKRLHTPDDFEDLEAHGPSPGPRRKKRQAAKKGWKGWVEGSPPPSEKLINLDAVPVLQERRTRSGKNFDAISIGKDGWV